MHNIQVFICSNLQFQPESSTSFVSLPCSGALHSSPVNKLFSRLSSCGFVVSELVWGQLMAVANLQVGKSWPQKGGFLLLYLWLRLRWFFPSHAVQVFPQAGQTSFLITCNWVQKWHRFLKDSWGWADLPLGRDCDSSDWARWSFVCELYIASLFSTWWYP